MRVIIGVLVLLVGCAAISQDSRTNGDQGRRETMRPPRSSSLKMVLTAEPLTLARGDTLFVRLEVTNDGGSPYRKGFPNGCIFGFGLWSAAGRLVAPPPPFCTMNAPMVVFEPGEVHTRQFAWVWDDPGLESGTYELYAGFGPRGEHESAPPVEVRLR